MAYPAFDAALGDSMPGIREEDIVEYAASVTIPATTKNMIVLPRWRKHLHQTKRLRSVISMFARRVLNMLARAKKNRNANWRLLM